MSVKSSLERLLLQLAAWFARFLAGFRLGRQRKLEDDILGVMIEIREPKNPKSVWLYVSRKPVVEDIPFSVAFPREHHGRQNLEFRLRKIKYEIKLQWRKGWYSASQQDIQKTMRKLAERGQLELTSLPGELYQVKRTGPLHVHAGPKQDESVGGSEKQGEGESSSGLKPAEGLVGIVLAFLVEILNRTENRSPLIPVVMFAAAVLICLNVGRRLPWVTKANSRRKRRLRLSIVSSAIILGFGVFGLWTFGSSRVPGSFQGLVSGRKIGKCDTGPKASAVQFFEHGWLFDKFSEDGGKLYALTTNNSGAVHWYRKTSEWRKEVPVACVGIAGESLLRWSFRWWYCSPDSDSLRKDLGEPKAKEITAWVQYQQWSEGMLLVGLPGNYPDAEGEFDYLVSAFLKDANQSDVSEGFGKYRRLSALSLACNPYCNAIWYYAPTVSNSGAKATNPALEKRTDCKVKHFQDEFIKARGDCSLCLE